MTLFGQIKNTCEAAWNIIREAWYFLFTSLRYNASVRTAQDPEKLCYLIVREAHTLEKGMSLRTPRPGFGYLKAQRLMERLELFATRYSYTPRIENALSILAVYLKDYGDYPDLKGRYARILALFGNPDVRSQAGTMLSGERNVSSFAGVLESRHSCRYFKQAPVPEALIEQALALARLTPSACNRQAWRTHVFEGKDCHRLLAWQDGCHGFESEPTACILVTASRKAFLHYEMYQAYVDGALYGMTLIYALESLGLATLPLSCGFHSWKLSGLSRFDIPASEAPVMIVAFGYPEENMRVAVSSRKEISTTNTFHR